ncbi:MAG: hypothetical protein ACLTSS_06720 [Phocaeicola coprocola]
MESGKYAYIAYSYDPTTVNNTTKMIDVQLYGCSQLADGYVLPSAPTEDDANAPIYMMLQVRVVQVDRLLLFSIN